MGNLMGKDHLLFQTAEGMKGQFKNGEKHGKGSFHFP